MATTANGEIVVKDACIFFDLIDLGLLANFYELGLTVITTPQVIDEVKDEQQLAAINVHLANGKLLVDQFGQLDEVITILENNPGLGFTDASVIEAATRRQAIILSSDNSLRKDSNRRGIVVRGLLWILEELYVSKILTLEALLHNLTAYQAFNRRAPRDKIQAMITKYTDSKM